MTRPALVARVVIDSATPAFDREYDYAVPDAMSGRAAKGALATVPFGVGNAKRFAVVLSVYDACRSDRTDLKSILSFADDAPALTSENIELAAFMRERYFCTWFDAFRHMLPKGWDGAPGALRASSIKGIELTNPDAYAGSFAGGDGLSLTSAQRRAYGTLARIGSAATPVAFAAAPINPAATSIGSAAIPIGSAAIPVTRAMELSGASRSVFEMLVKKSVARFVDIENDRRPADGWAPTPDAMHTLTSEQTRAIETAISLLERGEYARMLLHGVTGSGKTEVYLRVIARALELGKGCVVLVPEISLTPQMISRFRGRFGGAAAIFHSGLSPVERKDQWLRVKRGDARIAIGARSAVFAPLEKVDLTIIDEEHESSYKSEMAPRYHAKDIAEFRCKASGGLLIMGSATPSVELAYTAQDASDPTVVYASMKSRAVSHGLPSVTVVDMREELKRGNRGIFSARLLRGIERAISDGKQAILLQNRRGYSSFVLCRDCGYIATCRDCSVSYSWHMRTGRLHCHYCGMTQHMPDKCPSCGGGNIRQFGVGTERVEAEVNRLFPSCRTIRMDRDTTSAKGSHARILGEFKDRRADVLVGTQMIAKGHDFPDVALVGVVAADSSLNYDDYRAPERAFSLLTQVAGRAGRGDSAGEAVIQTFNPDHYCVAAAKEHDYWAFYKQELAVRRALSYPPFSHVGVVILASCDDGRCEAGVGALREAMAAASESPKSDRARSFEAHSFTVSSSGASSSVARSAAARSSVESSSVACSSVASSSAFASTKPQVFMPTRAPVEKIKGKFRWRIIVKSREEDAVRDALRRAVDAYADRKMSSFADLSVDVDPFSLS